MCSHMSNGLYNVPEKPPRTEGDFQRILSNLILDGKLLLEPAHQTCVAWGIATEADGTQVRSIQIFAGAREPRCQRNSSDPQDALRKPYPRARSSQAFIKCWKGYDAVAGNIRVVNPLKTDITDTVIG